MLPNDQSCPEKVVVAEAPDAAFSYQPLYGGDVSVPFWRWVDTLPLEAASCVYTLACEIQEREAKIRHLGRIYGLRVLTDHVAD